MWNGIILLADSGRLDQAEAICNQQQDEQRDGKPYTQRQGLDGTICFAFILHHENECGSEAGDDENEGKGNKDFHGEYGATGMSGSANACYRKDNDEGSIVMPIVFRFRWVPLIAALLAVSVGLLLGQWQTRRALEKESIEQKLLTRANAAPIVLDARAEILDEIEYRRVKLNGQFVSGWPIYLDNRPYKGGAGFYVLMPFKLANSPVHVLIARGWIPRNNNERSKLPTLLTPGGTLEVQGLVRRNPGRLLQLGPEAPLLPDAVVQNLDIATFAAASKLEMKPFLVEQLNDTQDGLSRDWPSPSSGAEKHRAYAFQWYALAAMAFLFFVATGFRRGTR